MAILVTLHNPKCPLVKPVKDMKALIFDQTNETFGVVDMPRVLLNKIGIKTAEYSQIGLKESYGILNLLASLAVVKLPEIDYFVRNLNIHFFPIVRVQCIL